MGLTDNGVYRKMSVSINMGDHPLDFGGPIFEQDDVLDMFDDHSLYIPV